MDFQRRLLDVSKALSTEDVKALAFLCTDLLRRTLNPADSANELFVRLQEQDLLSEERPQLLTELLVTLRRSRLVSELNLSNRGAAASGLVTPYRKLLYELSEEITDEGLGEMKFLLRNTLKRRALEDNCTTLDVFLEMERTDHLSDSNLDELKEMLQVICPVLREKIEQFKAQQVCETHHIAQESKEPMCSSLISNQGSLSPCLELNPPGNHHSVTCADDDNDNVVEQFSSLRTGTEPFTRSTIGSDALPASSTEEEILVSTESKRKKTEGLQSYAMNAATRGVCLIINNYNFKKTGILSNREGTKIDEECLVKVFTWLGFKTEVHHDCTSGQIKNLVQDLGRRDHSAMDSVVCCILSHGKEGSVLGVDGIPVEFTDLREPLKGYNCYSLAKKPKMFFIQACQGTDNQRPVWVEADGPADSSVCCDAVKVKPIPADADFLFAMSTVPSCVSFRDKTAGTWFMQSLCKNLVDMVPRGSDLVSILTKVNADVSRMTDSCGVRKQMPQPQFTLTKLVVFPLPKAAPPNLPFV
ncbi:caspase-8 [Betta splendens]|uniref:Caspase-8 n=1 Tax=Betta splendens TaxID=158456 RepID=A0A6P7LFV0_BETSP|nr:caspase-8 [Betta splendens]XP_028993498.1 caspase-8 [Betta splendens]